MTEKRPLIGVPAMSSAKAKGLRFSASVVANAVLEAIVRAGGDPCILTPLHNWQDPASRVWDVLDGIVLPGGPDMNPARYEQVADENYAGTDYEGQDDADAAIIRIAEQRKLPTLLICRGMQLWNVERGGDMVQHWPSDQQQHVDTVHGISAEPDSLVATVLAEDSADVTVSSYHHQALGGIGRGLRVTARAVDGCVEAIEDALLPILAVQWHPEDRAATLASDQALFDWVVREAARYGTGREYRESV